MKKALGFVLMLAATAALAADKSWTGTVTDAMCGKKHAMMAGKSDKECTLECVKMGSKYALVVGDKVYTLEGKTDGLEKFAGGKATVSGELKDDTITVASVSAAGASKTAGKAKKKA